MPAGAVIHEVGGGSVPAACGVDSKARGSGESHRTVIGRSRSGCPDWIQALLQPRLLRPGIRDDLPRAHGSHPCLRRRVGGASSVDTRTDVTIRHNGQRPMTRVARRRRVRITFG